MTNQNELRCSWCKSLIREGAHPVSHGICPRCFDKLMVNRAIEPTASREAARKCEQTGRGEP